VLPPGPHDLLGNEVTALQIMLAVMCVGTVAVVEIMLNTVRSIQKVLLNKV
jgi:hypothetical protein